MEKKPVRTIFSFLSLLFVLALSVFASPAGPEYDTNPHFTLSRSKPVTVKEAIRKTVDLYDPEHPYVVFINYELGMHCVGFDISYCCVIPPYNSVQAQAFKTSEGGRIPRQISPDDGLKLHYFIRDNSYSEGNKMKYWSVAKDVDGNGKMDDPGDSIANYVWSHLFIYKDLEGTIPPDWNKAKRLHIGKEIQIPIDAGPSGKSLAGGDLSYAGSGGGNKVFTDSLIPDLRNVPLTLTSSYLWDALGLPLTAFNDGKRRGTIRTITEKDFQPYQYSVVQILDRNGKPLMFEGGPIEFFGTNPVDFPNCYLCHSGQGTAAKLARKEGLSLFDKEYAYWKENYPDVSEFMVRELQASINVLELHDKHYSTTLLKEYRPDASSNRLGATGPVNCTDCHGDNISGNLQSPRPGATGYKAVRARALSEAVHMTHVVNVPMPDKAGRTQNCQACHPSHWQPEKMNDPATNRYRIADTEGNPRFSNSDVRISGGGCYLRRDAHTNPDVRPPFFLNEIGKWFFKEVSMKDEAGKPARQARGLYCSHCHNQLSLELYKSDNLNDTVLQEGVTLRNKSLPEVIETVAKGDARKFREFFADPLVGAEGEPLRSYYEKHAGAILARASKDSAGKMSILPWNANEGDPVTYDAASGGKDWWLSAGEPHCADCHQAPFVESEGGGYFPIDQPNKYSLYRYSKAHGEIACQSCHESIHGLYPVRYEGPEGTVDITTHEQALQFSPDGNYDGPISCSACHRVNGKGVPVQLQGTSYYQDYWASVVLLHFMREGDQKLTIDDLTGKYPYRKSQKIVQNGWQ